MNSGKIILVLGARQVGKTTLLRLIAEDSRLKPLYLNGDEYDIRELFQKPMLLEKLLQALALQLGSEVKFNEVGQLIGADNETVERYIDILEKAFVIFTLPSLSRNNRNEIKKGKKIYFFDNGIRNSIIKNFNPVGLRNDVGALWENFLISERTKKMHYENTLSNRFFWRTTAQQEIDFIEERNGKLFGFEFKWNMRKSAKIPKQFTSNYPESIIKIITPENYTDFIL